MKTENSNSKKENHKSNQQPVISKTSIAAEVLEQAKSAAIDEIPVELQPSTLTSSKPKKARTAQGTKKSKKRQHSRACSVQVPGAIHAPLAEPDYASILEDQTDVSMGFFAGPDSINEFLNPANYKPRLVELHGHALNPFEKERIKIFASLAYETPFGNTKAYAVYSMLKTAYDDGLLKGVHTLIENSSGNTAAVLGILARIFGIKKVQAILPGDRPGTKGDMLRLLRVAEILDEHGVEEARRKGSEPGFCNLGQYENTANPAGVEKFLAPHICRQLSGKIDLLCTALGTTGTAIGCSKFFRNLSTIPIQMIGAYCEEGHPVPGARTLKRLKEIKFDWKSHLDVAWPVRREDAYRKSLELIRAGIPAGPSSGLALDGLHSQLRKIQESDPYLRGARGRDGIGRAVFICPDTFHLYINKYDTILDAKDFEQPS